MICVYPKILTYKQESVLNTFKLLKSMDYPDRMVQYITIKYPAIYGSSLENIYYKLQYYNSIGIHFAPIITPKNLIQSVDLTYARFEYFKTISYDPVHGGNFRHLFWSNSQFTKRFGKTNEELLEKYDFKEYKKILK